MKEKLEKRLAELRKEWESGRKMMAEQEARLSSLKESLLRISGAIQILEESLPATEGETTVQEVA